MQHCLETASSLLPVEQPGCLAVLLSPLTFPLVLQLPLFPCACWCRAKLPPPSCLANLPKGARALGVGRGYGSDSTQDGACPAILPAEQPAPTTTCRRSQLLCLMCSTTRTALGAETQQKPFRGGYPLEWALPQKKTLRCCRAFGTAEQGF